MRFRCSHCGARKYWKLGNSEYRCRVCRRDSSGHPVNVLRLTKAAWERLIELYLIGANSPTLAAQTGKSLGTILKALRLLRACMARDVPEIFSGTVEVDETYLGGQWKNKRKGVRALEVPSKRGRGTTKKPVFGILARNGRVWAELVDDVEASDLVPLIRAQVKKGSKICSDTWRAYTGLATNGYVHRTVEHGEGEYVRGKNHINGLEGFWGFLKRKLASKGGVRRHYLPLFLGEYVWRYNHRGESVEEQQKRLYQLLSDRFGARY